MTLRMAKPFAVSIYSYNYAPEPTGIPFYNTGMAEWMRRQLGWRVTVHAGIPHYPWWRVPDHYAHRDYRAGRGDEIIAGVEVQRVRHFVPSPPLSGLARMRLDASYLWRTCVRSFTQRRKPQVIIIIAPPFLGGFLGLFLRWRWRVPVCYHVQDLQVDAALDLNMLPRRLGQVLLWLERYILARVDLVSTVSHGMRTRLRSKTHTRRPLLMFPNWADTGAIKPWTGSNRMRMEWGASADTIIVMYSGNLGKKQGVDILLEAASLLGDRILLVIAGEGAERQELETKAHTMPGLNVRFQSLVAAESLSEFLSAGDIHCIPQRRAASGLVMPSKLLNIMAVARPVLVTAPQDSDLAWAVRRSDAGEVVEPENPTALAAGLERLIADPDKRRRHGACGRTYIQRHLSIDTILSAYCRQLIHLVAACTRTTVADK